MEDIKLDLRSMTIEDIEEFCENIGEKKYRAKQIFRWLYNNVEDIEAMTNLPQLLRYKISRSAYISNAKIEKKYESKIDSTIKYLLKFEDDNIIECVLMKYSYGISACLSTQIGCRMGCSFCASTIGGLVRNLSPGEMVDEIVSIQKDCNDRISNIVLMGSGEPFDNFDNVIKFLKIINTDEGLNIGMRHVTLSTCGLVPEIKKLADLNLQITLAISLHAPNDEIRRKMMPVANKYTIDEILESCRYYIYATNRRITFEYSLINGVNDSIENAMQLSVLLKNLLCHVNLIPINEISENDYKKTNSNRVNEFKRKLEYSGIAVTVRRELGADINAACGQLRKNYINYL